MTHLRKRMLEELQRRNYSEGTTRAYLQAVQQFAVHFGKSPDKLGPDDLRTRYDHYYHCVPIRSPLKHSHSDRKECQPPQPWQRGQGSPGPCGQP